ncbi:hypothetical protein [Taklimakanibacter albus]|uniref:Uncharacterized protein n=1 Tax=Taklimakanibacter albus TaxID=2800327 RepID=A0ACC5REA8_9HYPH|nr:hypothetical protein [Aestuariivirga sp. YIM B02566]MBK1870728.1 hypothetical protein [Aestuariivirga sp. YIM B02566]
MYLSLFPAVVKRDYFTAYDFNTRREQKYCAETKLPRGIKLQFVFLFADTGAPPVLFESHLPDGPETGRLLLEGLLVLVCRSQSEVRTFRGFLGDAGDHPGVIDSWPIEP